ncbi:MAG: potassium-transporting ATPase KdpC subunit [Chloroflexota bacterium]|jgi:K+-transporting ATPase ATPase C chain|nr:potassium-transporting ATPase KdpC subunit [Chloroflexota bacterium]
MVKSISRDLGTSARLLILMALVCCLAYTYAVTGLAQVLFPGQANGSLLSRNGQTVGSSLIGQEFSDAKYFAGRPSATTSETDPSKAAPYNAQNSAGSNLGPSNQALVDRVKASVAAVKKANPTITGDVPVDMVTADFSGFDPYVTPASAQLQVARVAATRNLDPARVMALVKAHTEGPAFGIFGESHVNVLVLNLALDDGAAG